jgi:ABC-type multidrug transport system ATPase subunit
LISARNILKEYKEPKKVALSGVSLELCKGEIVGVIGPNGAGKSTLFNILSMITGRTEGTITVIGKPMHALDIIKEPRKIGIVAQDNIFWDELTLEQNL